MESQGIIVGCDHKRQYLLPWWWEHYSRHNSHPVAFADFGMSADALAWCSEKGQCIHLPSSKILLEDIPSWRRERWEKQYGTGIWDPRSGWFQKPLALLHSPYLYGIWVDLDCQINGPLDPLFNSLSFGAEIALVQEPSCFQDYQKARGDQLPEEVAYNAGVIVFRQNAPILHHWAKEARERNGEHVGDQQALNRAIFIHLPSLIELPAHYNWVHILGPNPEALIYHFTGGEGKIEILKKGDPKLLHLLYRM